MFGVVRLSVERRNRPEAGSPSTRPGLGLRCQCFLRATGSAFPDEACQVAGSGVAAEGAVTYPRNCMYRMVRT